MTTRLTPPTAPSAQGTAPAGAIAAERERRASRLRWFLVGHVVAALVIFGLAVQVGGGFAGIPMPVATLAGTEAASSKPAGAKQPLADVPTTASEYRDSVPAWATQAEVSAPWSGGNSRPQGASR